LKEGINIKRRCKNYAKHFFAKKNIFTIWPQEREEKMFFHFFSAKLDWIATKSYDFSQKSQDGIISTEK
jgi:hypothetical protein